MLNAPCQASANGTKSLNNLEAALFPGWERSAGSRDSAVELTKAVGAQNSIHFSKAVQPNTDSHCAPRQDASKGAQGDLTE